MGLDIYLHAVKGDREVRDYLKIYSEREDYRSKQFKKRKQDWETAKSKVPQEDLKAWLLNNPEPDFEFEYTCEELDEVKTLGNKLKFLRELAQYSDDEDVYLRKENWMYRFAHNEGSKIDEFSLTLDINNLRDLICRMDKVLDHTTFTDKEFTPQGEFTPEFEDYLNKLVNKQQKVANQELPTTSGFFFGSIDYGEGYFYAIHKYRKLIKSLMRKMKKYDLKTVLYVDSW